jgi:hypothetical protein
MIYITLVSGYIVRSVQLYCLELCILQLQLLLLGPARTETGTLQCRQLTLQRWAALRWQNLCSAAEAALDWRVTTVSPNNQADCLTNSATLHNLLGSLELLPFDSYCHMTRTRPHKAMLKWTWQRTYVFEPAKITSGAIMRDVLPPSQKECRFIISDILFDHLSYSIFFINIIYFVMTYFIIRDPLIIIYLFYNLYKIFE